MQMRPARRSRRSLAYTLLAWAAVFATCLPTAALAAAARDCCVVGDATSAVETTPAANHACCGSTAELGIDETVSPDAPRDHEKHRVPDEGPQRACASSCCYVHAVTSSAADVVASDGLVVANVLPAHSLTDNWVNDPALPPPRI
jgi:hypothetical protein